MSARWTSELQGNQCSVTRGAAEPPGSIARHPPSGRLKVRDRRRDRLDRCRAEIALASFELVAVSLAHTAFFSY